MAKLQLAKILEVKLQKHTVDRKLRTLAGLIQYFKDEVERFVGVFRRRPQFCSDTKKKKSSYNCYLLIYYI
jgi:hypothetical protein